MQLTVVIVNYNVRHFLEQTLLAVRRAVVGLEAEVFVVDNNSRDDSVAMVRTQFPEVTLIANTDNPGFSRANNQAIRRARGQYVLLLNPDTVVGEDTFRACLEFMDAHPRAGGLGVRMIDGSGIFLPESKRGFPSPWVAFCKTFGLAAIFPRSKRFGRYHLGYLSPTDTHAIDVLSGAFMWMRRSVLDEIGLLDEQFFMYGEDIDLSYRIKLAGYDNYYFAGTSIIHYKGESTKKGSLNYVRVFYQAMIIFARKHFTGGRAGLFVFMLQLAIYFRAFVTIVKNFLGSILLPLVDAALIFVGMVVLKNFWATNYFQDATYYPPSFLRVNVPLYIVGWLGAVYFSGGYDPPGRLRRLVRGLLVGTVFLAAIYGFLPLELRSSRTLLVLGAVWAVAATVGVRTLLHFFRYGNFGVGQLPPRRLAIVGSAAESERVRRLLERAGNGANYIGTIDPERNHLPPQECLGSPTELPSLIDLYQLDELIFCAADVSNQSIIGWMSRFGPALTYRIVQPGGPSIIGSHSKNSRGELYTMEVQYQIAGATARREKRLFDLGICVLAVLFLPLLLLLPGGRRLLGQLPRVFIGRKTWVGYEPTAGLPGIRPPVWRVTEGLAVSETTETRLTFLYARDWEVREDWRMIRRILAG